MAVDIGASRTGLLSLPEPLRPEEILAVLELLAQQHGIDLRDYRSSTLVRRLPLRMHVTGCASVSDYLRRLETDSGEAMRLLCTLLVPVTSFFRDLEVFMALERHVLPALFEATAARRPVRVWAAGIATGEEAWSVAMLLSELSGGLEGAAFEVLGTDLDAGVLETAQAGCYPLAALDAVPEALRSRYFEPGPGRTARVAEHLRAQVRFAQHDLVGQRLAPKEAIMASFDLVLVRNVLIYFVPRLQGKALERFAAVLEPDGVLVLGQAEGLPHEARERFLAYPGLPPRLRLFRKVS